ncbi:hypothetical protein KA062_02820 [Patescibacteria group bacterium]|nr:hypothetical protein [Patescibacteria group bacterium]
MKLKNIFKKRPNEVYLLKKEIQEKLDSLENRIFNKKKTSNTFTFLSSPWFSWEPETLEQEISDLQDKLDVIAKHLGLEFKQESEKEKEWVVKPIKKSKK